MKFKRIVGAALAAILALGLTVPVMAAGRDETIPGEGKIGLFQTQTKAPTIHEIEEDDTLVYGTNADKTNPALQDNIPGATVTVTWPGGQGRTQAIVDSTGRWQVSANGISLKDGDLVRAVQQEPGKSVSLETIAVVGAGKGTTPERSMSPTIAITEEGDRVMRGSNLDKYPGQEHLQENVPGSDIVVSFPGGETVTTTVNTAGVWEINVPASVDLKDGDRVTAVQTEQDKLPSHPTTVIVGSGEPGFVVPPIDITRPEDYLVLSFPASFEWYVNQTNPTKVQYEDPYEVTVYSLELAGTEYDATVLVTLASFEQTGGDVLGNNLKLYFDEDFGDKITDELSDGVSDKEIGRISTYDASPYDDTVSFGFKGTYSGNLSSNIKVPTYTMVLNFLLEATTAPIDLA